MNAETLALYEPLAIPFGLQFVVIFAGSAAFGPGRRKVSAPVPVPVAVEAPATDDVEKVSRYLLQVLKSGGKIGSITELAELAGVHISNASRAATALEEAGHVQRHRDGRKVALRLVA